MALLWRLRLCCGEQLTALGSLVVIRAETPREARDGRREQLCGPIGFAEAGACFPESHAGVCPPIVPLWINFLDVTAPSLQVRECIFVLATHDQDPSHREVGAFVIPVSFRERGPHDFGGATGVGECAFRVSGPLSCEGQG